MKLDLNEQELNTIFMILCKEQYDYRWKHNGNENFIIYSIIKKILMVNKRYEKN